MKEGELVEFLYMLFGVGIVTAAYYPKVFSAVLPIITLIGAAYLVWGVVSRVVSGVFGIGGSRRDEWWSGLAILTVVVLIYGQPSAAIHAVSFFAYLVWGVVVGVITLAL